MINSDTYILMYDVYNAGRYEFAVSTDLMNFTKDPAAISFDFTPRHGTIIPITSAEKNALIAKWNPTAITGRPAKSMSPASCRYGNRSLYLTSGSFASDISVRISDLSGKTVLKRSIIGESTIDLMPMAPGVYHVICNSGRVDSWSTMIIVR